jgi:hypothetical protein
VNVPTPEFEPPRFEALGVKKPLVSLPLASVLDGTLPVGVVVLDGALACVVVGGTEPVLVVVPVLPFPVDPVLVLLAAVVVVGADVVRGAELALLLPVLEGVLDVDEVLDGALEAPLAGLPVLEVVPP